MRNNNLFSSFLRSLGVKHTTFFSERYYNEHPYKYSLFGLSKMLSDYGIENAGIKLSGEDKNITLLEPPLIAHVSSDFVIVDKITEDSVSYNWNNKNINITIEEFNNLWDGIVLVAEPNENSREPNYNDNIKKTFFDYIQKSILACACIVLVIIGFISNDIYKNIGLCVLLIINIVGIYIGCLLILKQIQIQSNIADKLCSLFKKSDCNDILQSPAAKFLGLIGWSEVGLGYFISNAIIILYFPYLLSYLALINICALPYTIWSIWYQKFKAGQWCPLCLIVQCLIWCIFFVNLLFGFIKIPSLSIIEILLIACIYSIPFLITSMLLPIVSRSYKADLVVQEMNSLKMKDEVFVAILQKQSHYHVNKQTSNILFGNKDADVLITILTNPHCGPCAQMHKRVEKLLNVIGARICIQYVFCSFSNELDDSNKILIAAYQNKDNWSEIFHDWYEWGKNSKDDFLVKFDIKYDRTEVGKEFNTHEAWIKSTKLSATPTILINGYELPNNYKIEDLAYFSDLVIDTK